MRTRRQAPAPVIRRTYRTGDERAREILDAALELFAEHGFATTVQAITDRIGVTQPLIHRYFPTKAALFDAVKQELLRGHWSLEWQRMLTDRSRPMSVRLNELYGNYLPMIYRRVWYRGFLHIAIQDGAFAQIYLTQIESDLLTTVLQETRDHFNLPANAEVPFQERELELIWGMHSTFVFIGMRKFIYNLPLPSDLAGVIHDQTSGYLQAAQRVMAEVIAGTQGQNPRVGEAG